MISLKNIRLDDLKPSDVNEEYIYYQSSAEEHKFQMAEDEEFYLGLQLTQSQKDYLVSVGQPPEANNKIRPAVEQVLSNVAGSSPEWDVRPTGKTDSEVAFVYNKLLDKIWYDSDGDRHFRSIVKDFTVKGIGYMYVYPDWQAEQGRGGIKVKRVAPENIYVDPNCTDPFFRDASSIILSDTSTKSAMKVMFPDYADEIEEANEDYRDDDYATSKYNRDDIIRKSDVTDDGQPKVRRYIRWSKVNEEQVLLTDNLTGKQKTFTKEEYDEFKKSERYKVYVKENQVDEEKIYVTRVRETFVVGDIMIYDIVLPIEDYPIVPACNEHNGNPYPAGDVRHAKTPQRMLNRTEALLISHATSTASFKLIYEDGAIDPEELEKWFVPNAIIRANPSALREGKIKELSPPAISSQLYVEKQRYETDIETVFGAYKFQQGNPSGAVGTFGEARILDEASSRKQNWKILPVYDMLTNVGKIVSKYIPYVYDKERVLRVMNPLGIEKEMKINVPVINDYTLAIERMYDVTTAEVDIRVVIGSTRSKSPTADLAKDIQLLQAGIYDKAQVIMGLQGDVDKSALMARMSEIGQLRAQNQQLQKQLQAMTGDLQTRERELFHTKMRAEISEATKPVQQAVSNLRATAKNEERKQKQMTQDTAIDLAELTNTVNSQPQAPTPSDEQMGIG
jgi:hypothetical protein|tara:strand:- start:1157 stop:3187 length:2031 start_codon:yes stop_codon:yes gene_type:complete